ncbi:MAG: SPOR domain-containing protein, partial [Chitinophagaceae bacterium]|nr:SPOR domain-containing protein [Polaromonas sp.]
NAVKPLVMPARTEATAIGAQADQSDKSAASKPVIVKPYPAAILPTAALPATAAKPKAPVNDKVTAAASLSDQEEILNDKKPVASVLQPSAAIKKEVKPASKVDLKPEAKPESKPATKPEPKPTKPSAGSDDGARAKALLEGGQSTVSPISATSATTGARSERLVVQVGAFADADKAHEIRLKLEKAGLKTYTQVTETAAGKRIRVRVGPFASKADADKAASKIKTLDLSATVLTL